MPSIDPAPLSTADGQISYLSDRKPQSRRPLRGTAHLLISGRPPLPVKILDAGVSGVSIVAALNAPVDAECGIRFALPTGLQLLTIETKVVVQQSVFSRIDDGFRVGLRFKGLSLDQASALRSFAGG